MSSKSLVPDGMLLVASDVAPDHDADFNDWYDREHVEERARVPGFISAARYESIVGGRRYLGLYRTESLATFMAPAYKAAFGQQTAWSITNLDRMVKPMRRVCTVAANVGQGSGSWLSILALQTPLDQASTAEQAADLGACLASRPGFVRSFLLAPSLALSSPLPKEATAERRMLPILVIETSSFDANQAAYAEAKKSLSCEAEDSGRYMLKWKLFSHELARP